DRNTVIARYPRLTQRGQSHDNLDHYLEVLLAKPGALAGSTALATARAEGTFTAVHDAFWSAARQAHGDRDGTRLLIEVLLLHRRLAAEFVTAGITETLHAGSTSPDLVAIESRKAEKAHRDAHPLLEDADCADLGIDTVIMPALADNTPDPRQAPARPAGAEVISLCSRAPELREQPLPSLDIYDQLLTRHQKGSSA
ncbi:MAG: IS21 family transposase, partial [Mycobacteriales bacterium]